ncbi:tyrosine-type recombinase/integrase [Leptospira interrogans]
MSIERGSFDRAASPTCGVAFSHCDDAEYVTFLAGLPVTQGFRTMRRRYRRAFVERWPRVEDWFDAPFDERIGRLFGETQKRPSFSASYRARSYLFYLTLTGRLRLDYDWLLTVGDLCVAPVAEALGVDLGVAELVRQGTQYGYQPGSVAASTSWAMSRIALHNGLSSVNDVRYEHIAELLDAIERFDQRQDVGRFCTRSAIELKRCWRINARQLQLLLYHRGQLGEYPTLPKKRRDPPPSDRPLMQEAIDRWIAIRRLTLSDHTVDHQVVSLRHFMAHLVTAAPEVKRFSDLTRDHALRFVSSMAENARAVTGRSLSATARRARIAAIIMFFRDAIAWGWPEMPTRPLLDHRDMPKMPARIPRYIPTDELAKLMSAVAALPCPYQRAALLIARWSGARRGEICRLPVDCLDAYPDGTARLRVPAGKTLKERVVPLHDDAADALRAIIALRKAAIDQPLLDNRTGDNVRFLFFRRGRPMSAFYLFDYALRDACAAAGLVDAAGRATVTAHRFRHTVGTQLAERGAKLHTIMSVLGHESPHMSMIYARISDAEVLRDYRSVLEPGAVIAGAGADAIRAGALDDPAIDWLRSNFFKTELELGHCLRLPSEGPCECDLYLSCSRFVTTPAYVPRLRERRKVELGLADDARERDWPREVERHCSIARRIEQLLVDLGEVTE